MSEDNRHLFRQAAIDAHLNKRTGEPLALKRWPAVGIATALSLLAIAACLLIDAPQ
jgi:hypothetical protein